MKPLRLIAAFICLWAWFTPSELHAQPAQLVNLSTRGPVGTGADILIGGFSISGGSKTVLVRGIGPGLDGYGVSGTLPDPILNIFNSAGAIVATNDNWQSVDASTISQVSAFPFAERSKDAVIVATLPPGGYTAQISGLGATKTGVGMLEVYDVTGAGQLVNIATRLQVGIGANAAFAGFVVAPGSGTRKLLIRGVGPALAGFGLPGALPDPKLTVFNSSSQILAVAVANGSVAALESARQQVAAFELTAADAATIVTLSPGSYTVQLSGNNAATTGLGMIEVYDITNSVDTPTALASATPKLYYSSLRPNSAATTSTASGYATILFDPNTNVATISVNFSNLTSSATSAHLVIGSNASSGNFVFNLPRAQANALTWTFPSTGAYSTAQLIAALQSGQLFVSIDSTSFPAGELQGGFALATGSITFTAPAAPPALSATALTAPSQTDAARFLTQATFGPTAASIAALQARGINGWIDDQMALPATGALIAIRAEAATFPNPPPVGGGQMSYAYIDHLHAAWWRLSITAPDQLRQRVAFALSEIFVVGFQSGLEFNSAAKAKYYDLLLDGAFGNYRPLLEAITLSPTMGYWLSYMSNQKADPAKGTAPDENYAREIQQLFSIGLVQLQPDGTLLLDSTGQPIPTYNQVTISETAKVFTGWSAATLPATTTSVSAYAGIFPGTLTHTDNADTHPWFQPMRYYDAFHDKTEKRIVSLQQVPLANATPSIIPANQSGPQDLQRMLDTLFHHPNTGPFICRRLIQRLVTSNPSPGYVYRVARVFADDGKGVRGNLGAVVRAILTDYEARSLDLLVNVGFGKIKEPLLRSTAFFRILNGIAPNGRFMDASYRETVVLDPFHFMTRPITFLGQGPLASPTVFNFFSPNYSPPGAMAAAGLAAPELEITDSNFSVQVPNQLVNFMYRDYAALPHPATGPSPFITLDYSALLPLAKRTSELVDQLNLLFCANQMTAATRAQMLTTLELLPAAATDLERIQTAIQFTIISPDSALQK